MYGCSVGFDGLRCDQGTKRLLNLSYFSVFQHATTVTMVQIVRCGVATVKTTRFATGLRVGVMAAAHSVSVG